MIALKRIRIIILAIMIFGAFANFALNEWGSTLILFCVLGIGLTFFSNMLLIMRHRKKINFRPRLTKSLTSLLYAFISIPILIIASLFISPRLGDTLGFLWLATSVLLAFVIIAESIYDLIKKTNNYLLFENFLIFCFFLGMLFKTMHWPGASLLLIFSVLLLTFHFLHQMFHVVKSNFQKNKALTIIFAFFYLSTILFGLATASKMQSFPFKFTLYCSALVMLIPILLAFFKWSYNYNNKRINIIKALNFINSNLIFSFVLALLYCSHFYLSNAGYMPKFYNRGLPQAYYDLRSSGREIDVMKAIQIQDAYGHLIEEAQKNGFIEN